MHSVHFYENEIAFISQLIWTCAIVSQFFTKYSSAQLTKKYFYMHFGTRLITFFAV